jgi:hypothetical protein
MSIQPRSRQASYADSRRRLVDNIGTWIVNRRMQQLIQEGKAAYQSASVRKAAFFSVADQFNAEAEAEPTHWAAAFRGLLTEMQRARQYGFSAQEVEDAKQAMLSAAERAAQTASTRDAQGFLRDMNRAVSNDERPMAAAQALDVLGQLCGGGPAKCLRPLPPISTRPLAYVLTRQNDRTRSAESGGVADAGQRHARQPCGAVANYSPADHFAGARTAVWRHQ